MGSPPATPPAVAMRPGGQATVVRAGRRLSQPDREGSSMASRVSTRPNLLVILSDDQGFWAMGSAGNKEIHTPNLDALAASGTTLSRFFAASPVCSPARASLLTGRMPSAHGVHDFLRPAGPGQFHLQDYLAGFNTTPDVLAAAGWRCAISGKWHLGSDGRLAHGFEHAYLHAGGQGPYNAAPMWRNGELVTEQGYISTLITSDALSFLETTASDERPFYLSVNYTAPHSPWVNEHPPEIVARYDDCAFESCPQEAPHPWWSAPAAAIANAMADPRPSLQGYYAAVTAMDAEIGRLLQWLDATDLRSSTLVVFLSDNGFSCGHHGIWGKGNSTWPLNVFEESVRVPAIVSQPGTLPAGATCDALVSGCDLHPTLVEAAGIPLPHDPFAAGHSFWSIVTSTGDTKDSREHICVYDEYGDTRMVRTRDWKYVDRGDTAPNELYSLAEDPYERTNLAGDAARKAIQSDLHALLYDWFSSHADPDLDARGAGVAGAGQAQPFRARTATGRVFYERAGLNPGY